MKALFRLFLLCLTFLPALVSCSEKDEVTPDGPKEYEVEYRLSSTTDSKADFVLFENETGGDTQLSNVALPVTYKFKRTMKLGDVASISGSVDGAPDAEITATVLLDGKEKHKVTARGSGSLATAVFIIGQ